MLSIRAMVRIGPWTVTERLKVAPPERCERCRTKIAHVWCCEVDATFDGLAALGGKRHWRVGNECGPQLVAVSDEIWTASTGNTAKRMAMLLRLDKAISEAARVGYSLPASLIERRSQLVDGSLPVSLFKHVSGLLGVHERGLGLRR